jgi:hypothetical protein
LGAGIPPGPVGIGDQKSYANCFLVKSMALSRAASFLSQLSTSNVHADPDGTSAPPVPPKVPSYCRVFGVRLQKGSGSVIEFIEHLYKHLATTSN